MRLLQLDDSWTAHLTRGQATPEPERAAIAEVAQELSQLLDEVAAGAERTARLANARPELLRQAFLRIMLDESTPDNYKAHLRSFIARKGPLPVIAMRSAEALKAGLQREREYNEEQVRLFMEGKPARGRLSEESLCRIAGTAIVAGAMGIGTPTGGFVFGFGVGVMLAAEISGDGC